MMEAPVTDDLVIGEPEPTPEFHAPTEVSDGPSLAGGDFLAEEEVSFDLPDSPVADSPMDEAPAAEAAAPGEPVATPEFVAPVEPEPAVVETPEEPPVAEETPEAPAAADAAPVQFGRRTPEDKAKSLARSLVSDIVAYYAEKHATAKAGGTLAQDFEEEVEKCLKEYQEQVDAGVLQNNTFLNDALNDILADGEPVFNVPA